MRQWQIQVDGSLKLINSKIPLPKKNEVLIKVKAIGLNRADILQRKNLYPAAIDNIPGLEVSGVAENGQHVAALLSGGGGYSEFVCVDKRHIINLKKDFDLVMAAALPEALCTSLMVLALAKVKLGANVLIHGGSSGVGSFLIQIAKNIGCKVFASAGNQAKIDFCYQLGADFSFNYQENNFSQLLKAYGGIDLVVDILGGIYLEENLKCLNKSGKLILLAVMQGAKAQINLGAVLMKSLKIIGSTLNSKTPTLKAKYIRRVDEQLMPLVYQKKVIPQVDTIFKFEDMCLAHQRLISREHLGKVVVRL